MRKIKMLHKIITIVLVWILFSYTSSLSSHENKKWEIFICNLLQNDEAINVAIKDLQETGSKYGIEFALSENNKKLSQNSILVGSPARNDLTAKLINNNKIILEGIENPQGYEIVTKVIDGNKVMIVSGGSIIGDVYGLYWIWDRLRVLKELPDINIKRVPELKIRFTCLGNKQEIQNALRYSATWVSGGRSVNH